MYVCMTKCPDDIADVLGAKGARLVLRLLNGVPTRGFPKIRGTMLGVPIIRIIVYWGLYWGPLILGNYHKDFARGSQPCGRVVSH